MPGRPTPLITDQIYHVFNRGINRQPTFTSKPEFQRATQAINFYRYASQKVKLSTFLRIDQKRQKKILDILDENSKLVEILGYCLMPNHFHFLLKQSQNNGISKFMSNFQNSYTRYFNVLHKRDGALFLDQFKAVRIEVDEQLIHVSRYIHLNPYSGYVVKEKENLKQYLWSSLLDYLNNTNNFVETELIIKIIGNHQKYEQFIFDQADYQRKLKSIQHLALE